MILNDFGEGIDGLIYAELFTGRNFKACLDPTTAKALYFFHFFIFLLLSYIYYNTDLFRTRAHTRLSSSKSSSSSKLL